MATHRRTRLSADERRTSILAAARDEFIHSGFGGARTRDIAERAGVTEALLFRHFSSKDAMFSAAVIDPLIEIMGTSLQTADLALEPGERIDEAWLKTRSTMFRLLEVMCDAMPMLGVALFADNDQATELYRTHITPILNAGAARLRKNYDLWEHRPYDTELMPRIAMGMCLFVVLDAHFGGSTLNLNSAADEFASLISYGTKSRLSPERANEG